VISAYVFARQYLRALSATNGMTMAEQRLFDTGIGIGTVWAHNCQCVEREVIKMPFDWKTRVELKLYELNEAQFIRKQLQDLVTSGEPSHEEVLTVAPPIEVPKGNK
jgi:hypothetical protein